MWNRKHLLLVVYIFLLVTECVWAQNEICLDTPWLSEHASAPDVNTEWTYQPYDNSFYEDSWYEPYRKDGNFLIPYFLTPKTRFVGTEEYIQTVDIPESWQNKIVTLTLERVHIKSRVWINEQEARSLYVCPEMNYGCRSLGVPHRYDLTGLVRAGQSNEIRISISNTLDSVPVGRNSYSVSDDDQGNWNGIVGRIVLNAQDRTHIVSRKTRIETDVESSSARISIDICNDASNMRRGKNARKLTLYLETEAGTVCVPFLAESDTIHQVVTLTGLTKHWDEYSPNLYHLNILLTEGWSKQRHKENAKDGKKQVLDSQSLTFGVRNIAADNHFIKVNGRRVLVRGTVDGAHFPLTGYPPTDIAYWVGYMCKLKKWGMNMVRFHSWCPPEAAFVAADSIGIYLQPECSSWPNHDVNLDADNPTAGYIWQEAEQIIAEYGNHPSFVFLAAGNEPRGHWEEFASRWVEHWKQNDSRRLYTSFSTGGSWPWIRENQIHVRAGLRGLEWQWKRPESLSDFSLSIDTLAQPFIGHEVGQWCTFPDLKEISEYTGLMQPGNLIIFGDKLRQNGLYHLADSFLIASGRLQTICYKHEMEKIRRTANYAGYHLQALADYPGQGTATEGILNVFYEPKGYCSPKEWLQWAGDVVLLMRTRQFTYKDKDTLRFSLDLSNFGAKDLTNLSAGYKIIDDAGQIIMERNLGVRSYCQGNLTCIAEEAIELSTLPVSNKALDIVASVGQFTNKWRIWVYESEPNLKKGDVYVTRVPDQKAIETLQNGGKVLLLCYDQVNYGRNIKQMLTPVFWNTLWVKTYSPHTLGLLIDHHHPVFRKFATSFHSDVQWWELVNKTYPMLLDEMPAELKPMVRTIDNAYKSRQLGMMFEARVGKGRILVTNIDLLNRLEDRIVARQLLSSVLSYMNSDEFSPDCELNFQQIMNLFIKFKQT